MVNPILPKAQSTLSDKVGITTREWYEFFRRLLQFVEQSGADPGVIQDILNRLDELEQNGNNFSIQGLMSVDVFGTPAGGVVQIQLEGDVQSPGNTYYYGTGPTGVKGFYTVASALAEGVNIDLITGLDGVTTIVMPAAGDGSTARKPIQYNADALDTLGADAGFTYDPTVGVKLLENEGPASFRAITDTATLGAELTTNGTFTGSAAGWTLGAGWAYGVNNVVLTNPGAGTLSQNISVVNGTAYLVSWTQNHSVSNSAILTPTIGAVSGIGTSYNAPGVNTQNQVIVAGATGSLALTFTPTAGTTGTVTIDTVSVVAVAVIPFTLELENVAGATSFEARALAASSNVALGLQAGRSNTTGVNNTYVGLQAGRSNTTGMDNAFYGREAGTNNTTGTNLTFLGREAGFSNTTGLSNTFVGYRAGRNTTTGFNTTCLGRDAGFANTTGSNNSFFGREAGLSNTTGSGNTFEGFQSGRFQADGVSLLTDPENSLYLGSMTRGFSNADDNTIVVGFSAIGRGANTAQWGNSSILDHYFSGSINLNQTSLADLGAGVFRMLNATTAPTVNPVNGVVIYAEGGAAKCRGSGGTTTTFGPSRPHCKTCGTDFVHEWENFQRGYGYLAVCMNCFANDVKSVTRVKGEWDEEPF